MHNPPLSLAEIQREIDQHSIMFGLALKDGDKADAQRHLTEMGPVLHKRMNDEYQAWAKLNSPTTAQHVDKWFSILRANGVGF